MTIFPILTRVAPTTPSTSFCPKCGIIKRSGKASCCGHGGSWFENCGSANNQKLDHTWYEGVRACETLQFQTAAVQKLNVSQIESNASNDVPGMVMNSEAAFMAAYMFRSTPAAPSTPLPSVTSMTSHDNASIIAPVRQFVSKASGVPTTTMAPSHTTS